MSGSLGVYDFKVNGASPGTNGVICVVAPDIRDAHRIAQKGLEGMNIYRAEQGQSALTIDRGKRTRAFSGTGVVYIHSGEE